METPSVEATATNQVNDGPTFKLSGAMSLEEFDAAAKLMAKAKGRRPIVWLLLATAAVGVNLLGMAGVFHDELSIEFWVMLFVALCVVLPACLLTGNWMRRSTIKDSARKKTGWFQTAEYRISARGSVVSTPGLREESDWRWCAAFCANERVAITIGHGWDDYGIICRRLMEDPSQWESMLSLIESKVPRIPLNA